MGKSLESDKKASGKYVCKKKDGRVRQVRQLLGKDSGSSTEADGVDNENSVPPARGTRTYWA
jgi:hypothetical protein